MYETFEGVGVEGREVILRQVQVDQTLHATERPTFHIHDFAALQVEGHHLRNASKAVARNVVEVVATQVEESGVG